MRRVDVSGIAIEARSGAPLVVLRERSEPHRLLPVFLGAPEASAIALAATGQRAPEPLVHDVMAALVRSLDGTVERVEVGGGADGSVVAAIAVSSPNGTRRVGSRPADALALAVRMGASIWVDDRVLDAAGVLPEPIDGNATAATADPAAIDAAVDDFRSFLDGVSPADFIDVAPAPDGADALDADGVDGDGVDDGADGQASPGDS